MESTGEFFEWEESLNIADVLIAIRDNMHLERVSNDSSDMSSTSYVDNENEDDEENEDT